MRRATPTIALGAALSIYAIFLAREAFWLAPGPQDNDWPLLMWLARAGTQGNLAAFAVGHYGFLQLVLVRICGPIVGGTIVAAKLINIVSVLVTCLALDQLLRAADARAAWRIAAVCFFALSYPTFVTGWSEFGDPFALALYACGLALALRSSDTGTVVFGGALIGAAGLVRLHFQAMGWGTALAFAGFEVSRSRWSAAVKQVAWFTTAVLAGQLPVFLLNWHVHGTLFSPIARTFMGQVLFGANEFDMARSYAAAPFDGLLSQHGVMLVSVVADRILQAPLLPAIAVVVCTLTLVHRDSGQRLRAFAALLAMGYYVGFVAPSWGITPRLLLGFMFFAALSVGLVGPLLEGWRGQRVATLGAIALVVLCALHFRSERRDFRALRSRTRATWDRNELITQTLRARGIDSPTQVFAADWYLYPTDDPEMVGFYNWGFWNLLVPEFAAERPNPFEATATPESFERFMMRRGVRAMVLYDEPRVPALGAITRGEYKLRAYRLLARVDDQYIYGVVE